MVNYARRCTQRAQSSSQTWSADRARDSAGTVLGNGLNSPSVEPPTGHPLEACAGSHGHDNRMRRRVSAGT